LLIKCRPCNSDITAFDVCDTVKQCLEKADRLRIVGIVR
jgi:hypothetical protein